RIVTDCSNRHMGRVLCKEKHRPPDAPMRFTVIFAAMRLPVVGYWLAWIALSVPVHAWAQAPPCGGNAGENIFIAGDFGSGAANVFPSNPGLAPGYAYTTAVPPDDGEYTITNDMNRWSFAFPAWLRVGDNSPDP